jgi:hypothetical protein
MRRGESTATAASGESKQAMVVAMLQSPKGTTIPAIMKATGWQQHSVRGFFAAVVRKRLKLKLDSTKVDGVRVYRIGNAGKRAARHSEQASALLARFKIGPTLPDRNALDVEIAQRRVSRAVPLGGPVGPVGGDNTGQGTETHPLSAGSETISQIWVLWGKAVALLRYQ